MKPILFNTEMVKAILEGRKTTTRRIAKWQRREEFINNNLSQCVADKYGNDAYSLHQKIGDCWNEITHPLKPDYKSGDILYVREAWALYEDEYIYRADSVLLDDWYRACWHPSIHMPKKAARLFLKVTDVRIERLQNISNDEIINEGVRPGIVKHYENQMPYEETENIRYAHEIAFADLWNSTIKTGDYDLYSWEANPWVWVIEFERISKEAAYGKS